MNPEATSAMPISTTTSVQDAGPTDSCRENESKPALPNNTLPGLPSPPLSPHQQSSSGQESPSSSPQLTETLRTLQPSLDAVASAIDTPQSPEDSASDSVDEYDPPDSLVPEPSILIASPSPSSLRNDTITPDTPSTDSHMMAFGPSEQIDPTAMLPSQLRKHHESLRLSARIQQKVHLTQSQNDLDSTESSTPSLNDTTMTSGAPSVNSFMMEDESDQEAASSMLPSQLRKRHESLRLAAREQQQEQKISKPEVKKADVNDYEERESSIDSTIPFIQLSPAQSSSESGDILIMESTVHEDSGHDESELLAASYHSGALIRTKSHSESSAVHGRSVPHSWGPAQSYASAMASSHAADHVEMPTKDWIRMHSKIQELELEVSHVKRTNLLLNVELDKVNGHLARLTANGNDDDAEGWRREYEFLVQQVDWMHRQLQLAQANQQQQQQRQQHRQQQQPKQQTLPQQQEQQLTCSHMADMSATGMVLRPQLEVAMARELRAEVKDLTASLKLWRSAFQQAEEMYRHKCEGERELKKTLREREAQLSSLAGKLTGYESEVQKSIANYEEFLQLSAEMLDGADNSNMDNRSDTVNAKVGGRPRSPLPLNRQSSPQQDASVHPGIGVMAEKGEIPGTFPGLRWRRNSIRGEVTTVDAATLTVDQLSVAILSWLALLTTYMLS
ncbi:MAG: hypothetical protein J3Q66DRAFT_328352 [Benniella sp.]|nr:MAG: hypothetical protein J3Q66DRAFT_328352 [Benniella sp.]